MRSSFLQAPASLPIPSPSCPIPSAAGQPFTSLRSSVSGRDTRDTEGFPSEEQNVTFISIRQLQPQGERIEGPGKVRGVGGGDRSEKTGRRWTSKEQVARIGLLAGGGVQASAPLGGRNNFGGGPDNARIRDLTAELPARASSPHAAAVNASCEEGATSTAVDEGPPSYSTVQGCGGEDEQQKPRIITI